MGKGKGRRTAHPTAPHTTDDVTVSVPVRGDALVYIHPVVHAVIAGLRHARRGRGQPVPVGEALGEAGRVGKSA